MITKISLVTVHHHSCFKAKIIFLVMRTFKIYLFISIQSLSHVQLFSIPWTAAHQASLSLTNPWSLLKLMSIELVMTSNHLILCHPLLLMPSIFFPASGSFPMSPLFASSGQNIRASASALVLSINIQVDFF